jgi:hypothetical protein
VSYIGNEPTSVAFLTDTFSGNGSTTAFTLSAAPATTSSILVAITGVLQDPSTYSVSGTTLTFSPAPPTGTSNISVRFLGIPASGVTTTAYRTVTEFTATSGQTTFNVPSYTVGFIDVYQNGVMLGSADYTATSGLTVVLAIGATVGDLVEVISFQVSSILNAIPTTGGTFSGNVLFDSGDGIWNTSGQVGIGTSSPNTPLSIVANHVGGQGVIKIQTVTSYASGGLSSISLNDSDGSRKGFIYQDSTGLALEGIDATPISLLNNGSTRLRINSAGQVTTPFQPMFFIGTRNTNSSAVNLIYSNVIVNVGSHYSTSTGRFTCPVAGTYIFQWGSLFGTNNTVGRFTLRRNGSDVGGNSDINQLRLDASASGSEIVQGERSFIVTASASDYFNIYFVSDDGSTNSTSETYAFFGGYLIG